MRKKMGEPTVYHYGSNEPTCTIAPKFEWRVNTFNIVKKINLKLLEYKKLLYDVLDFC
jgi:hypothetical protein